MDFSTMGFAAFLGIVATIFFTVLAYIFIIPEKRREKLNKLGQFLHDIFNFKFLIIEKVLQFFYVLATVACICGGLSMIFGFTAYEWRDEVFTEWYGLYGILAAVVGPFVIRLVYEGIMLSLLLVKNVIQINKKLKSQVPEQEYQAPTLKELFNKENFSFLSKKNSENTDAQ